MKFFIFQRNLAVCMKTRYCFIVFKDFFATFQRKQTILILDLYIYSIKIQTNIKKNS
jgi:hypothetical protein